MTFLPRSSKGSSSTSIWLSPQYPVIIHISSAVTYLKQPEIFSLLILLPLSGLAFNFSFLIVARTIQGMGMGILMPLSQTILGVLIPPRQRGKYQGYMGAVMGASQVAGPLIGGWITAEMAILASPRVRGPREVCCWCVPVSGPCRGRRRRG